MTDTNPNIEDVEAFRLRARAWLPDNMPPRQEGVGHFRDFDRGRELQ